MRNYVKELREMGLREDRKEISQLAEYMNLRLIATNRTIFEYIPAIDGIREDYAHLHPVVQELLAKGFFDGN